MTQVFSNKLSKIIFTISPIVFFIFSYCLFLVYYFLKMGGEVYFCHDKLFSAEYAVCSDKIEAFQDPLITYSLVLAMIAFLILNINLVLDAKKRIKYLFFIGYFVPISSMILLLGFVPIEVGLGFLGSSTIYLFKPLLLFCIGSLFSGALIIYLGNIKSLVAILFSAYLVVVVLVFVNYKILGAVDYVANHDENIGLSSTETKEDCDEFYYERYKEKCLKRLDEIEKTILKNQARKREENL